ncbi:PSD1 and planctomycete cytochrome C domain-containing protein [Adhaeretor mobilis]|uniref:Planctomycete cytochrome C n=1 Tax=Adhaeretor mobilis TaxID=1930276 RepID=A0A517MUL8_9BACT|nr:PSD1 and planctomycete cytochrome C domain-containing protein [Adhaeretor mobilis]QDS98487.1 Planctomycete cytochrome C [Adhaeretor mobilis]
MRFITGTPLRLAAILVTVFVSVGTNCLADEVDFFTDIAPILQTRCWHCHGEDEQESGLRLDRRVNMLLGGDSGLAAVVPAEPAKSYLIEVVNHVDEDMAMPPDDEKLPQSEIDLLTHWIKEGAKWPGQMEEATREKSDHWSFQPVQLPEIPETAENDLNSNPVDAFLAQRLAEEGLSFSTPADPRSLILRASIVLIGIAPTPEQIETFAHKCSENPERAYAELVERLLASPHFGERWAQHWLDVIRWAETNGSESNMYRKNAWVYRDYVIRAFNEDKPYDQFLREQIAGDVMEQGEATGYLVSGPHVPLATVGQEPSARRQARADRMDEILQTVGASALGLTIGCARCHNHKFDPISITDYYSVSAVFQGIEFGSRFPELPAAHPRNLRGKELQRRIRQKREQLQELGPWEEDWIGFKEVHFTPVETDAVRLTFERQTIRIDELEIFAAEEADKNIALASQGTTVASSQEGSISRFPVENVNDGVFGSDAWIARPPGNSQTKPFVQFTFEQPQQVNRIRLSTNREDFFQTDYLKKLNDMGFGEFQVEARDGEGNWQKVATYQGREQLDQEPSRRSDLLLELHELIQQLRDQGPRPSFLAKFVQPTKTYVLGRGSPENPRNEVFPSGLAELDGELAVEPYAPGPKRRQAFAAWLTQPEHPLTARVAVNRLWHHIFGQGIVSTPSDFGAAGISPTHPELLDWLAAELVLPTTSTISLKPQPWSMKHLIRTMVMSRAFRQSSLPREEGLSKDSDSALLWRFPPKRVEAEVIRDSILQASGVLDSEIGGPSYRIHNVKEKYSQWEVTDNYGPHTWRRMIYQERMRRVDDEMFTAFDFPDCGQVRAKRPVSTTPLQALNLLNSKFVLDQSQRIAERAMRESDGEESLALDRCFELILGRNPSEVERRDALRVVKENSLSLVCRALINSNEFAFLP